MQRSIGARILAILLSVAGICVYVSLFLFIEVTGSGEAVEQGPILLMTGDFLWSSFSFAAFLLPLYFLYPALVLFRGKPASLIGYDLNASLPPFLTLALLLRLALTPDGSVLTDFVTASFGRTGGIVVVSLVLLLEALLFTSYRMKLQSRAAVRTKKAPGAVPGRTQDEKTAGEVESVPLPLPLYHGDFKASQPASAGIPALRVRISEEPKKRHGEAVRVGKEVSNIHRGSDLLSEGFTFRAPVIPEPPALRTMKSTGPGNGLPPVNDDEEMPFEVSGDGSIPTGIDEKIDDETPAGEADGDGGAGETVALDRVNEEEFFEEEPDSVGGDAGLSIGDEREPAAEEEEYEEVDDEYLEISLDEALLDEGLQGDTGGVEPAVDLNRGGAGSDDGEGPDDDEDDFEEPEAGGEPNDTDYPDEEIGEASGFEDETPGDDTEDDIDGEGDDASYDADDEFLQEIDEEIDEEIEEELHEEARVPEPVGAVSGESTSVGRFSETAAPVHPPVKHRPYAVPIKGLLKEYEDAEYRTIDEPTRKAAEVLMTTLQEFNIKADVTGIRKGPVITMFEILPAPGVKLSKIVNLADNIALRLAASSVRIVAPIPGKHAVGIEVPNKLRAIVSFSEMLSDDSFTSAKTEIPVALGKDISGNVQIMDLVQTPHLLIAGATGSGKSVCVNALICSILYRRAPSEVQLMLIDPKIVELKFYNDIPHLLTPVITEPKKAFQALQWCIYEMERRYTLLDALGVRDIRSYNRRIRDRNLATQKLPYIVVVIDEFADLMATTGKELESTLARLAAMSRAVGIHLVLATQRPSIDVITGLIKANIPSRIAFMVASKFDSRIIIDAVGAEKLLGRGDMLFASAWDPFPVRLQGAYLTEEEVERVVAYVKTFGKPDYIDDEIFFDDDEEEDMYEEGEDDPLMEKAVDIIVSAGKASASYLQRRLKIGYNRAARLVENLERRGVVGPQNGSKPREILHIPDDLRGQE